MIKTSLKIFYLLQLKISTYLKNREVQTTFKSETSPGPDNKKLIYLVVIMAILLFFFSLWILIKIIPAPEKIAKKIALPLAKKQPNTPQQVYTDVATAKQDEEKIKKIEPVLIIEKENDDHEISPDYMRATGNLVNVRAAPVLESDIVARLGEGYIVNKLKQEGDWIYSDAGHGFKGWIYYDLLENATIEDYQSWENNQSNTAVIGLMRRDLEDQKNLDIEKENIKKLIFSWKVAWEKKDIDRYIYLYSKAFRKQTFNWEGYRKYKKLIFSKPGIISVELENINISWDNFFMTASFTQKYRSGSLNTTTTKMLHFQQEKDGWKIVKEMVANR